MKIVIDLGDELNEAQRTKLLESLDLDTLSDAVYGFLEDNGRENGWEEAVWVEEVKIEN